MLCLDCNPTMADGAVSADSRAQSTVSLTWFLRCRSSLSCPN